MAWSVSSLECVELGVCRAWSVSSLISMNAKRADRATDTVIRYSSWFDRLSLWRVYCMPGRIYGCLHHRFRLPCGVSCFPPKLELLPGLRILTFLRALLSCHLGPLCVGSRGWRDVSSPQRGTVNDAVPRDDLEQHGPTGKSK
jgi:hypothetical protein